MRNHNIVARLILVGVFGLCLAGWFAKPFFVATAVIGTVMEKQGQAGQGNYIVFIKQDDGTRESLANKDAHSRLKYNSTDIQGELEKGKRYKFYVLGERWQFFSSYRNILAFEELKEGAN